MYAGGSVVVDIPLRFALQVGLRCFQRCECRGDLYRGFVNDGDCDSAGVGRVEQSNIGSVVTRFSLAVGVQPSNRCDEQYNDRGFGGSAAVLVVFSSALNAAAAYYQLIGTGHLWSCAGEGVSPSRRGRILCAE